MPPARDVPASSTAPGAGSPASSTATSSRFALAALAGAVASAALVALAAFTSGLLVALLAVPALAVTAFAALWTAVDAGGPARSRPVLATQAGALGAMLVVALSATPWALAVPLVALLLAAAARRSLPLLGAAVLLGVTTLLAVR